MPTIATKVINDHIAISLDDQPLVFVFLTVVINTVAKITTDTAKLIIPLTKFPICFTPDKIF